MTTPPAAVASFGMLLRGSRYAGTASMDAVTDRAEEGVGADPGGYRREFVGHLRRSKDLPRQFALGRLCRPATPYPCGRPAESARER